ncbi:MAG TPA: hypothetical protein VER36_09195 [Flavisolibacter sp.]|nr:hypothetical protein [Flavisolibacter sp.]
MRKRWLNIARRSGSTSSANNVSGIRQGTEEGLIKEQETLSGRHKKILILSALVLVTGAAICWQQNWISAKQDKSNTTEERVLLQLEKHIRQSLGKQGGSYRAVHWTRPTKTASIVGTTSYRLTLVFETTDSNGKARMHSKDFEVEENGSVLFEFDVGPFNGF